jgi:DNA modification methylase
LEQTFVLTLAPATALVGAFFFLIMQILKELEVLIPPLTSEEFKQLERNILEEGIRDPLVTWNGILVDGHNRYRIATEYDIDFVTIEKEFADMNAVKEWMINNQFGRRNLNNYQRSVLALQLEDVFKAKAKENYIQNVGRPNKSEQISAPIKPIETRQEIAKVANVSHDTISKVKKIEATASPEIKAKVSTGEISINEAFKEIKKEENEVKINIEKEIRKQVIEDSKDKIISNVFNGNSLEMIDNIDFKIKCVITDPPYGMNYISNRRTASLKDKGIENDKDIDTAMDLIKNVFTKLYGKMDVNSGLFCFIGWKQENYIYEILENIGFNIKNSIVWNKNNHGTGDLIYSFAPKHERIIYATKGKVELNYRYPDVLDGNDFRTNHPTQKPIDLLKTLINSITMEDETIVDPFAGHGSTGIAAKESNRKYWLCELDYENYCNIKKNLND